MGSVSTATFRKQRTCPSAESLLLYHDATLTRARGRDVELHLAGCDFCAAELFLLTRYPPGSCACYTPAQMPEPLKRLALELLAAPSRIISRTLDFVYHSDRLTLTDA